MRVALCLSGITGASGSRKGGGSMGENIHPEIGHSFWKSSLLDHYDVDVFLHCWQPEKGPILDFLYKPKKTLYEEQMEWHPKTGDWLKEYNYPLDTMEDLLKDKRYADLPASYGDEVWDDLRHHAARSRSRWCANKKVVELKKQYEEDNSFKYDIVIVSRYDLWFGHIFPLDQLEKGYFYASQRTNGDTLRDDHEYALQDLLFLGDSELVDKFYTLYDYIPDYAIESPKAAWEQMERFVGLDRFKFFPWKFHKEYQLLRWKYSEKQLSERTRNPRIEMVIFDLDGVLVDACEWHRIALNEALLNINNYEISLEDHYKEYNGIPTKVKLQKLIDKGIIEEDKIDLIYSVKQKKTIEIINKNAFIRPEKVELLKWLKKQNVYVVCFTNSIRKTTMLMLEKTGIVNLFDLIITNQDVEKPKPSPEGYLLALKYFNVNSNKAIIIEDSPRGLAAAQASRCKVIQVGSPESVNINLIKDYIE
tara:strand:+ start:1467 stop:2897 length:1431 start_codon:yes stop_codon:yes gene_type:complete